ncbi:hypothetical protein ES319_A02G080500v1, partial [Gossypium barbadense]
NLRSKQVVDTTICPRCGSGEEDISHVFRYCPVAVEVWQMLDLSWVNNFMFQSFWDWLTWIFQRSTHQQCRLFCYGIWFLWGSRNKLMHERKLESGRELSLKVQRYLVKLDGLTERRNTLNKDRSTRQSDTSSG